MQKNVEVIMYKPGFEEICQKVEIAIGILMKNDSFLLTNRVHERSISHKMGEYLQVLFPDWNVDCEYNRKGDASKKMKSVTECERNGSEESDENERSVYPDIIIHQRNKEENLLVIEIKTSNISPKCDIEKLKHFTSSDFEYKYSYGLFLRFKGINDPEYKWFEEGREI